MAVAVEWEWWNYRGGERMKVLVVFPDVKEAIAARRAKLGLPPLDATELDYGPDEVMQVVNQLRAKILSGKKATLGGMLDMLQEGWDILWLVTHGEDEGWYLSDGLVNVSEMTSLIRSAGVFLTVMNTCSSFEVASAAAEELGTAFICTLTPVPDRQAFITGALFAQKLAAGYDYVSAYQLAKPGQKHPYILIEASPTMRPDRFERGDRPVSPGVYRNLDQETLLRFVHSVEELDQIINGHQRLGLPALKDIVYSLQADLEAIKDKLELIESRQKVRNMLMWGIATGLLLLAIIVVVIISRQGIV